MDCSVDLTPRSTTLCGAADVVYAIPNVYCYCDPSVRRRSDLAPEDSVRASIYSLLYGKSEVRRCVLAKLLAWCLSASTSASAGRKFGYNFVRMAIGLLDLRG